MTIRWMLDTNICIYIAKQRPPEVRERFQRLAPGELGMSVVTYGELHYGAMKSRENLHALSSLRELSHLIPVLPMAPKAAEVYGEIRAQLSRAGTPIGNNDLWIAAHAMSLHLTLVTNNEREFRRVPGLSIENWVSHPPECP